MNGYLNLLEFIKHLGLNMVLNNEIIKYDDYIVPEWEVVKNG